MSKPEKQLATYYRFYAGMVKTFVGYETASYIIEPDGNRPGSHARYSKHECFPSLAQLIAREMLRCEDRIAGANGTIIRERAAIERLRLLMNANEVMHDVEAVLVAYRAVRTVSRPGPPQDPSCIDPTD